MESVTLSRAKKSLDIVKKVADNNRQLENGKEYPINLSLLGADKDSVECFQGTVTFSSGVGKVSNNLYKHLGIGATLKINGDGITLEGTGSQSFAVSSNFNGINIVGKDKDEREEEETFDGHTTPSKDNLNLKNDKNQKNARAKIANNSSKQTRQMVQDLRAMSNEFAITQRKDFIRNMPKLMYLIQLLETRNYQKAYNKIERESLGYNSLILVTASMVEDMHKIFHKTIDSILGHERKICNDCQQPVRNSYGLTKEGTANFVFSTITKFQEEYKRQYPDKEPPSFDELQSKIFPNISWNVLEYLQQQADKDTISKTKGFTLVPSNDKNLIDRLLGKNPDGSKTVIYKTPKSNPRNFRAVKFSEFWERRRNEPAKREPEATIDERQQSKIAKYVDAIQPVKEDKQEIGQAEQPSAEKPEEGASKQKRFRIVKVTKAPINEAPPERDFDLEKYKESIASLNATLSATTISPQSADGFVKQNPPTSNNTQQIENGKNPETSAEADKQPLLDNSTFSTYDGHTAVDWEKVALDISFDENELTHEHTHTYHGSEMASQLQELESQIETMIHRHSDELDKLDSNLDEFTFRIVWEHRKYAPEEMKNELHAYSDILSADKKLTPAQRKRELHIKREQIQARQNKVFEEKLAMQKKYQGMEYAKKLKKQAEERTALVKKLLELENEQYKKTTTPSYAPVLGDETQKALEHMQEELLQAITVLDNKIETLKTTGTLEEVQHYVQKKEDLIRAYTTIQKKTNCGKEQCPLYEAIMRERFLNPTNQFTAGENCYANLNRKRISKLSVSSHQQMLSIFNSSSQALPDSQTSSTSTSSAENNLDMYATEPTATSAYTHTNNVDYLAVLNPNHLHNAEAVYGIQIPPEVLEEIKSLTSKPLSREDFYGSLREQHLNQYNRIDTTRLREYYNNQAGPNGPANN